MKVLFIDDEPENIGIAIDEVRGSLDNVIISTEDDFAKVYGRISEFRPDILVIDLVNQAREGNEGELVGLDSLESIWETTFMPLVVYSGRPELLDVDIRAHPLVEVITKGPRSELLIVEAVKRLTPYVNLLTTTRLVVETQLSIVLKDVVPRILKTSMASTDQQIDAIGRASFRRLSALSDDAYDDAGSSAAWERYLVPPVSSNLLLGDILVKADAPLESVDEYRLILSPSCDLVATRERVPKVNSVLVAKCCSTRVGLQTLAIRRRPEDIKRRILSQGFYERMLPLPALVDVIPNMMANLTNLELIPFDDIGPGCNFKRVASVSSPFRELVGWAYIQTAGRPGLPETNLDSWAEEVVTDTNEQTS